MAGLSTEFTITWERRPCFVGEKRAYFHRWIDKEIPTLKVSAYLTQKAIDRISEKMRQGIIPDPNCEMIMQKCVLGLVEYEDGTVAEVEPTSIRFDVEQKQEQVKQDIEELLKGEPIMFSYEG